MRAALLPLALGLLALAAPPAAADLVDLSGITTPLDDCLKANVPGCIDFLVCVALKPLPLAASPHPEGVTIVVAGVFPSGC